MFYAEACQDAEVKRFRTEELKGQVMQPAEAAGWIQRTHEKVKPPAFPSAAATMEDTSSLYLRYWDGKSKCASVVPAPVGPLADLRRLSARLSETYLWSQAAAVTFIMCDWLPRYDRVRMEYRLNFTCHALSRMTLTIDPSISPRELAAIYENMRKQLGFVAGRRAQRTKTYQLVIFDAQHVDLKPEQALVLWNREHPRLKIGSQSQFNRDMGNALLGLRGQATSDHFETFAHGRKQTDSPITREEFIIRESARLRTKAGWQE